MEDYEQRFGGIARLYGREGLARLQCAHVAVIGVGGVGVWTAEALARSGVGALTRVDLDELCVTNINRQLHALTDSVGRAKVAVMAARIRAINPYCQVTAVQQFFTEQTAGEILAGKFDFVVDAIDGVTNKAFLIARCVAGKIPVVSCGAAGGRRDGTAVRLADLSHATHDRLFAQVRKRLREQHAFPAAGRVMGVPCVFSAEPPVFAQPDGSVSAERCAEEKDSRLNCNGGLGSATFVTGAFGFAAAGFVVKQLAEA